MNATKRFSPRTTARLVAAMEERLASGRHAAAGLRKEFDEAMSSQDLSDLVDEDGGQRQDPDELLALKELAEHHVTELEAALGRVENGDYGFCQECGSPIPLARLQAIPETPWCLDCSAKASRH